MSKMKWSIKPKTDQQMLDILISRGKRTPNGCFEYQGARSAGYGKINFNGKLWTVSRLMWRLMNSDPGNKMVLHKCDNPPCFLLGHLFLGTAKDNCDDAVKKKRWTGTYKTHCKRGHEYTPENTIKHVSRKEGKTPSGKRYCRTRHNAQVAERWRIKNQILRDV